MTLKISLNPILSVAAAVVAYASVADASGYYADYNTKTCKNTPLQAWGAHFTTIQECCTTDLSYVAENVCVAESNGQTPTGTDKWYINWDSQNCVQDCPVGTSNPNCGGLAAAWKSLFASQGECCEDSFTADYRGDCLVPSSSPSAAPSVSPSAAPSESPSSKPSAAPSESPSAKPSESPSDVPSAAPSESPSSAPSESPSDVPSAAPSESPSDVPSAAPSESPSSKPSASPSESPSSKPSVSPSGVPTWIGEFIVDQPNDKCVDKPAGDTWSATYTTIQQCCTQGLSWVRKQVCVSNSGGPTFGGTSQWYLDWSVEKCVKDCVSGTDCGGLAESYQPLYSTEAACCDATFTGTWRGNCPP